MYRSEPTLMCGICGIVAPFAPAEALEPRVRAMAASLRHRGPDGEGFFAAPGVAFGHRRLSVVDLAGGPQPMSNEDATVWVTYNGEIYNHAEFRPGLEAAGHRFRTRCDTEVLLHLYEEDGSDFVRRLNGMFGFALWDATRRQLLLARDPFGIKPVYYAELPGGGLVFASEIKALYASGLVAPAIDAEMLPEFFATGHVSGDQTLLSGVRTLPAGHRLTWQDGRVSVRRYTVLAPGPSYQAASLPAAAEEFWVRFRAAVESQLMADVPLGVFLSGGLDSSLIVAAMRDLGVSRIGSFSVGFAERDANELPWARKVARTLGTTHREVVIGAKDFFGALPELTWHRDLPLTFSASIPLHSVAVLAQQDVKVVLTGEGSDELFAGYGRYQRTRVNLTGARTLDALLPTRIREALRHALTALPDGYVGSRVKRSFLSRTADFEQIFLEPFADFDDTERARLLAPGVRGHAFPALQELNRDLWATAPVEAMLRYDQATYLEELLMKQDTMSMAASVESRVPFLDVPLATWAAQLHPSLNLRGRIGKAVVRQAARRWLPSEIIDAPKRGFTVPIAAWFRGLGGDALREHLPAADDVYLSRVRVEELLRRHQQGQDQAARLWRVLAFQVWRVHALPEGQRRFEAAKVLEDVPAC